MAKEVKNQKTQKTQTAKTTQTKKTSPKTEHKFDRKSMRDALLRRQKESEERKDYSKSSLFKSGIEGLQYFKCNDGDHFLDIIPFIAGDNHPTVPKGEPAYVLDLYVHRGSVADEDQQILCLQSTFNKKCPICEQRQILKNEGADEKVWKALYPKRRTIYNVVCYDNQKEEDKGVQIWNVAYFYMENHLVKLMKGPVRPGYKGKTSESYILFSDPDDGKSISFSVEKPKSKDDFPKFVGHRLVDRDYSISDEILEQAKTLDELITIPSYDEVYSLYWGEEAETKNKNKRKKNVVEETEEEETKEEELLEVEEEAEEEVEEEAEEVEEEAEEVEEEAEEPELDPDECPNDGEFGKDFNKMEDCETCPESQWELCKERSSEIKKALKEGTKKKGVRRKA